MKFFSLAFLLFLQLSFAGEYTFKGVLTLPNAQTPSGNPIGSIEVAYHLDAYFQEPTEKFVMSYTPVDENTRILGNAKFRARVYTGSHATEAYLHFSPITPAPNKKGWDFPGSPDWEDMFHTMTGGAISEARAREL